MNVTTRQGLSYRLGNQPVNGFAIHVIGGLVFRDAQHTWRFVRAGTAMNEFEKVGGALDILDYLYPRTDGRARALPMDGTDYHHDGEE